MLDAVTIKVVEGREVLDYQQVRLMGLPFDRGWEGWSVFIGDVSVGTYSSFSAADRASSSLKMLGA